MDFEQLSEKYKGIKSPIEETSGNNNTKSYNLIEFLKHDEFKTKKRSYRSYIFYAILTIIYTGIFILNPDKELLLLSRISGFCFAIAFTLLFFLHRKQFNKIKSASYLQSTKLFLENVRSRFTFWNMKFILLIPMLICINIGATLSILKYLGSYELLDKILISQAIFWSLMTIAYIFGRIHWLKNKKPILDKIDKMLVSFEE